MIRKISGKNKLSIHCFAKINLFLYVLSKRSDNYHDIFTLFYPINLYDTLTLIPATKTMLRCNVAYIPTNNKNIIMQTDEILRAEFGLMHHYTVDLVKRIPMGAGLGGGSSNAAGYILLVNEQAKLGLTHNDMKSVLSRVGSDTVFFLESQAMLGSGKGEVLHEICPLPEFFTLIVNPRISISTKDIYSDTNLQLTHEKEIPNINSSLTFDDLIGLMRNDLELPVVRLYPKVSELIKFLEGVGADKAMMSGSGSTVFAIFRTAISREHAYTELQKKYRTFFIKKV